MRSIVEKPILAYICGNPAKANRWKLMQLGTYEPIIWI